MENIIKWCNENQGFISAGLSLVAVFAAIGIPAFIAFRQNKIALFDKRFEVYLLLQKINSFYNSIHIYGYENGSYKDQMLCLTSWIYTQEEHHVIINAKDFIIDYDCQEPQRDGEDRANDVSELISIVKIEMIVLRKGELLFKGNLSQRIRELADAYDEFLNSLFDEYFYCNGLNKVDEKRSDFVLAAKKVNLLLNSRRTIRKQIRF